MRGIDTSGMESRIHILRRKDRDAKAIQELLYEAERFVATQLPAFQLEAIFCALDMRVLSVFLSVLRSASGATKVVWIICGDVPPAMVPSSAKTVGVALEEYCASMAKWVQRAQLNQPVEDVIPVLERQSLQPVEPTPEYAEMLSLRISFIRTRIVPQI